MSEDLGRSKLPAGRGDLSARLQPATQAWWFAAGRLLVTALVGLVLGWLFGNVWIGLGAALALHLGWQLINLFRLEWWLRHRSFADPPDVGGVFGEIIAQIVRLHRRKRFHKQRFVQLMRQLQRSTAALPNGVVILNAQREIIWFNRMASRLLDLRRTADLGLRIENLLRSPQFARYLEIGDFASPIVIRTTTRARIVIYPCRWSLMAKASSCCSSVMSRARCVSKPCVRTSSPMPLTNCAHR